MKRYLTKVFLEHFAIGLTISVSVAWMLAQGLTLPQIAIIESLALALGLAVDIPTGYLSDKFGRKVALVGAVIFQAASFLVFAFSHDFWQFLAAAILLAVGFALSSGSEEAYIYESQHDSDYRKAFSNVSVVDEAATIVGLLAAPALILFFNLQTVFIAAAACALITALISWVVLEGHKKAVISEGQQKDREKQQFINLIRRHLPLLLVFVVLAIYYEAGRVFWQPQLIGSGFKIEQFGLLFAAFKVASLIGAYVGRHQKFESKKEIVIFGLLMTISFLFIATSSWLLVIIGFALYSFLENVYRIAESNYLQSIASNERRASYLSAASFMRQGYSIVAVPLLSLVAITNISYAFYLLAGLQIIGALLFWVFAARYNKRPNRA
jgi:MFS family permease